jgi:hypothetical protein
MNALGCIDPNAVHPEQSIQFFRGRGFIQGDSSAVSTSRAFAHIYITGLLEELNLKVSGFACDFLDFRIGK